MTTPASTFASLIRGESEGSHPMKIAGQAFVQLSSKYTSHEDAYAAGAEAMRERAAQACEERGAAYRRTQAAGWVDTEHECRQCAAAIRLLGND